MRIVKYGYIFIFILCHVIFYSVLPVMYTLGDNESNESLRFYASFAFFGIL